MTTTTDAEAVKLARIGRYVDHVRYSAESAAQGACCTTDAARARYRVLAAGYASLRKTVTTVEALDLVAELAVEAEAVLDAELGRWAVEAAEWVE